MSVCRKTTGLIVDVERCHYSGDWPPAEASSEA